MNNLHKKSNTKHGDTTTGLTEERVREIAREEIEAWRKKMAKESRKTQEEMIKSGVFGFS